MHTQNHSDDQRCSHRPADNTNHIPDDCAMVELLEGPQGRPGGKLVHASNLRDDVLYAGFVQCSECGDEYGVFGFGDEIRIRASLDVCIHPDE